MMKQDSSKPGEAGLEQYSQDINWTAGVGQPAGIFWLHGRFAMAAHGSDAERRLMERGAVPIATLRFDADPLESVHRVGRVERVSAQRAWREYLVSGAN
jgi:hypothetical protein